MQEIVGFRKNKEHVQRMYNLFEIRRRLTQNVIAEKQAYIESNKHNKEEFIVGDRVNEYERRQLANKLGGYQFVPRWSNPYRITNIYIHERKVEIEPVWEHNKTCVKKVSVKHLMKLNFPLTENQIEQINLEILGDKGGKGRETQNVENAFSSQRVF